MVLHKHQLCKICHTILYIRVPSSKGFDSNWRGFSKNPFSSPSFSRFHRERPGYITLFIFCPTYRQNNFQSSSNYAFKLPTHPILVSTLQYLIPHITQSRSKTLSQSLIHDSPSFDSDDAKGSSKRSFFLHQIFSLCI